MLPCYGLIVWVPPQNTDTGALGLRVAVLGDTGSKGEVEAEGGRQGAALS